MSTICQYAFLLTSGAPPCETSSVRAGARRGVWAVKIEIKRWDNGATIFEGEFDTLALALEEAARKRVDLYRASLDGASLVGARLDGASLVGARLDGASLVGARLDRASLDGARLDRASLAGASLDGASLDRASLAGASLDGASLVGYRSDIRAVLDLAPNEVPGLLAALREGRVNGSVYSGECACLLGTIANVRGVKHDDLGPLRPNAGRPAERWFLSIKKGDTPENHSGAGMAVKWIEEWQAERGAMMRLIEAARGVPGLATAVADFDASRSMVTP